MGGSGPFPTELFDEMGEHLARRGDEFGATPGRPRRCGWFDAVGLRWARQINSISGLCVTKLDVLDGLDEIRICVGYDTPSGRLQALPTGAEAMEEVTPIYEDLPGWSESTVGIRTWNGLPPTARAYLDRIAEIAETPVDIVSTGPDRADTIVLRHPFA